MIGRALLLGLLAGCARPEPPAEPPHPQDRHRRPEALLDALALQPGQRVADVGAGSGYLTTRLARRVGPTGQVVATEVDERALVRLRERAAPFPQVQVRRAQADDPGLEAGRYDRVLLSQVDHLLPRAPCFLLLLLRALRPDGRLAVTNAERHEARLRQALAQLPVRVEQPALDLPAQFLLLIVRDPDSAVRDPDSTCPKSGHL